MNPETKTVLSASVNPSLLEEVKSKFAEWRQNSPRPRKIPEHLWEETLSLRQFYSITKICKELNIEFKALKRKFLAQNTSLDKMVELKLPASSTPSPFPVLEITNAKGATLRLFSGNCSDIIEAFMKS